MLKTMTRLDKIIWLMIILHGIEWLYIMYFLFGAL